MSALREEIRAILREEFVALRAETKATVPTVERVGVTSRAELTRFAQELLRRAQDPGFAARVMHGDVTFEPATPELIGGAIVSAPSRPAPDVLDKSLITERDITNLGPAARSLRLGPHSRLTPLARDEARRRGLRIERTER